LEHEIGVQKAEILRQKHLFRRNEGLPDLTGRTIILVDDGIATGATFFAAIDALRQLGVGNIAGAVPVGPATVIREMHYKVDELVVLIRPDNFRAVSEYYSDFRQTTDDEVARLLTSGRTLTTLKRPA
jgi:predicted phosphoribosyltransferase